MFRGFSTVSIDSKGRLAVPSRHRERLAELSNGQLVLTLDPFDHALWLYPLQDWESIDRKLSELSDYEKESRRTKQMMRGYACDCQPDSQGRILIPQELRDYARLEKQAVILGQGNKFEIWNQADWEAQRDDWLSRVGSEDGAAPESLRNLSL